MPLRLRYSIVSSRNKTTVRNVLNHCKCGIHDCFVRLTIQCRSTGVSRRQEVSTTQQTEAWNTATRKYEWICRQRSKIQTLLFYYQQRQQANSFFPWAPNYDLHIAWIRERWGWSGMNGEDDFLLFCGFCTAQRCILQVNNSANQNGNVIWPLTATSNFLTGRTSNRLV
jgi:hypothetical protein